MCANLGALPVITAYTQEIKAKGPGYIYLCVSAVFALTGKNLYIHKVMKAKLAFYADTGGESAV